MRDKYYEEKIKKLGEEVHDRIGQGVTALKLMVDIMIKSPEKDPQLLSEMRELIQQTHVDVRNLYEGLLSIKKKGGKTHGEPERKIARRGTRKAAGNH